MTRPTRGAKLARRRRRKARQDRPGSTQRPRVAPRDGDLIAYGAMCSWYDDKAKVGHKESGLPCCPHCGGVLFEIERDVWERGVTERLAFTHVADRADYPQLVAWARGRCYKTPLHMLAGWLEHLEEEGNP